MTNYPHITQLITRLEASGSSPDKALLVELFAVLDLAEEVAASKRPRFSKQERDEMFDALKKVCRLAENTPASYIAKTAGDLLTMGKVPADVYNFANWWYSQDFRGRKNQSPSMNQVVTMIEQSKGHRQADADGSRFISGKYAEEINY